MCRSSDGIGLPWSADIDPCILLAEADADEEEDWLLDSKSLWQDTICSATTLARQCEPFRSGLRSDPKVKQWLADSRGATQGKAHVIELSMLLEVLAKA